MRNARKRRLKRRKINIVVRKRPWATIKGGNNNNDIAFGKKGSKS